MRLRELAFPLFLSAQLFWACALPENNPPLPSGASGSAQGGSDPVGGTDSGGTAGSAEGGSTMGGTDSGGSDSGGTDSGGGTGGAGMGGTGGAGMGGTSPGGAGQGGSGPGGAGMGGDGMGGAGMGGAGMGGAGMGGAGMAGMGGTDACPSDPNKTAPGNCGCGFPEQGACIIHRYSFNGSGTTVEDSAGNADGTMMGGSQTGGGAVLSGSGEQHVALPAGILNPFDSGTFETWVTWSGSGDWQRIFDFGDNDGSGPGQQGPLGITYVFVTPRVNRGTALPMVISGVISTGGIDGEFRVDGTAALPTNTQTHVALTVDSPGQAITLYVNGASVGSNSGAFPLNAINDVNNWIGRSQFNADGEFAGTIHEFRIYSSARTAAQIQASYSAGPDTAPSN